MKKVRFSEIKINKGAGCGLKRRGALAMGCILLAALMLAGCAGSAGQGTGTGAGTSAGAAAGSTGESTAAAPSAQATEAAPETAKERYAFPKTGFSIPVPETALQNRDKVTLDTADLPLTDTVSAGIVAFLPAAENEELKEGTLSENLLMIMSVRGGGKEELEQSLASVGLYGLDLTEIGKTENAGYFRVALQRNEEIAEDMEEEIFEIRGRIEEELEECLKGISYTEPTGGNAAPGTVFSFETTDLEGNPVNSEELFKDHKVTMVNIWASWCGPCVREMPELQKISEEYAEKEGAIIGLLIDADDPAGAADAQDIIKDLGITYPVVAAPGNLSDYVLVNAVPTSIFVDSEGKILGEPVVGADTQMYRRRLDGHLGDAD